MSSNNYYRIMAGAKSVHIDECYEKSFIGGDWGINKDLSYELPELFQEFNKKYIPIFLELNPEKSKIAAGLACGMLHTICKGMKVNDVILSPDGQGNYYIGRVSSEYFYKYGEILPHRRKVDWREIKISREDMSQQLKNSAGSIGTVSNLTKYFEEIEILMTGNQQPTLIHNDTNVEDPVVFALEKHLEEFLVANWQSTELGKEYKIYSEDGEIIGQQFPSDTGPIDILAISNDGKTLLVVELKRGRASDSVVGQIQRYMGYIKDELAEPHQKVKGVVIALEDDIRLKRALSVTSGIEFYRYNVSFTLLKNS